MIISLPISCFTYFSPFSIYQDWFEVVLCRHSRIDLFGQVTSGSNPLPQQLPSRISVRYHYYYWVVYFYFYGAYYYLWLLLISSLMLLVANLANTKWSKNPEKLLKPWHMGTHLRVPSESYPMNTNTTGFRLFSEFRSISISIKGSAPIAKYFTTLALTARYHLLGFSPLHRFESRMGQVRRYQWPCVLGGGFPRSIPSLTIDYSTDI